MFTLTGEVELRVENLKPGNEITETMPSGALVIGETVTPFILQRRIRGDVDNLNMEKPAQVILVCFEQRTTAFTKQGYVSLLLTVPHGQFHVYIKREWLKDFYAEFCMSAITPLIN